MSQPRRGGSTRSAQRRRLTRSIGLLLLVSLLAVGWAGWQTWQGARDLEAAAEGVRAVRVDLGGPGSAGERLREIAVRTSAGREHLEDPLVRVLAAVPVVGDPLASATAVARAADLTVSKALLPLVSAAGDDPAQRLTSAPGAVDLDYLASLAAPAAAASQSLTAATARLADAPAETGVQRVDTAVSDFSQDLAELRKTIDDVALALDVAPELLGQDGVRRYLVVSQSPAEARGTGGLIGGYSLLEARDGALKIVGSGSKADLESPGEPVDYISQEFDEHYDANGATTGWINSNLSPHFPYAARIWQALWERQHGEKLDGSILLDPIALSYLLEATGPVGLPGGPEVSSANVVDLTLRDVYVRFPTAADEPEREAFLQQISTAVATALTTRDVAGRPLVEALSKAAEDRRLLLWSANDQVQAKLATQPISGSLPEGQRAIGDVIVDAAGSKLDYYLDRDLRYTEGCGRDSELALTLTNAAPASGLPEYVTPENFRRGEPPGTNIVLATLYLPPDSVITGLTLDGQGIDFRQGTELELVWVEVLAILRPGQSKKLVATFAEPESDQPVQRVQQPLVREETFTATTC